MKHLNCLVTLIIFLSGFSCLKAQNTFYYNHYKHWSPELEEKGKSGGDVMAIVSLGSCYDRADGVERDRQKALELFQKAADEGDFIAKYNLAYYYENGFCSEKDYQKAAALLEEALKLNPNFDPAYYKLGNLYDKGGFGLNINHEKAFHNFLISADKGDKVSQYKVGDYYKTGKGTAIDLEKSKEYFLKSAKQGFPISMFELARYYKGKGNYEEAARWFANASRQNFGVSSLELGQLYYNGQGVDQSYKKAYELYELAIKQDKQLASTCKFLMSFMLKHGQGVEKDSEKAESYLREAADAGNSQAQYMIGENYYSGNNEERDYEKAVIYYEKAFNNQKTPENIKGDICDKLAACYRFGRGVGVDKNKAAEFTNLASVYGKPDQKEIMEWLNSQNQ